MTPPAFSFEPHEGRREGEPPEPRESDKFWALWEVQPLGLIFYMIAMLVIATPGLIGIIVLDFVIKPQTLGWQLAMEMVVAFASVISLIMTVCFALRLPIRDTGFAVRGMVLETLTGYIIGMALMSVVIGVLTNTRHLIVIGHDDHYKPAMAVALCFFIALVEETIFRGYMLPAFERRWGTTAALVVSSFIFGAVHLMNVSHSPLGVQVRVVTFIAVEAGFLLGAAYLATRRLWLPIGIHWAWNFFLGPYYGAPVSGETLMGSFRKTILTGPSWITGGSFGPEAGVVAFAVCGTAAIALLIVAARSGQWRRAPEPAVVKPASADAV